jgi:hypothetical protein
VDHPVEPDAELVFEVSGVALIPHRLRRRFADRCLQRLGIGVAAVSTEIPADSVEKRIVTPATTFVVADPRQGLVEARRARRVRPRRGAVSGLILRAFDGRHRYHTAFAADHAGARTPAERAPCALGEERVCDINRVHSDEH